MRAFFFDLDGTLTDSQAGIVMCYRAALKAIGAPGASDEDLMGQVGAPLPLMLRAHKPGMAEAEIEQGIAAYRAAYERAGIFENRLYPGVRVMLEVLRESGRPGWIVTSKPAHYAEQVVDILGIRGLVAGVTGPGLDEHGGKCDLICQTLKAAELKPAQVVMLGDRHYDVTGALEAGAATVGALWGYGAQAELSEAGCRDFAASAEDFTRRYLA